MIRRFARPYAQAVLASTASLDEAQAVRDQMRAFRDAMELAPALAKMAANPAIPMDAKRSVVRQVGARLAVEGLAERCLLLLLDNYRLQYLPMVLEALEAEINRRLGVATAEVTTARAIEDEEVAKLRDVLARKLDREVLIELAVDPNLIAGFRARVGSTLYDASLRGQLDRLAQRLAEA